MAFSATGIELAYCQRFSTSARLSQRGHLLFPSGVTHDARFMKPFPIYIDSANGSRKTDVDGNELIDYWMGHGALLLGHGHPAVVEAVCRQAERSTHPGACHESELIWAEWIQRLMPSCERLRFTNSGTEATLMALQIVRVVTGKSKVVKFSGMFHGWHHQLADDSHGTNDVYGDVVMVPPNDLEAVARAIDEHSPAAVFHEGNGVRWGVVPARAPFLQALRKLTQEKNVLLVLDEVITGFRVQPGGFQAECGIVPDLTTLAKVMAGGLPGGAIGGRADLMQVLAFENSLGTKIKHPGTYNANPLSAAAGIAALKIIATGEPSQRANEIAAKLRAELNRLFAEKNVNWVAYGDYSAIKIFPDYNGPRPTTDDFIPYDNDDRLLNRQFDQKLSHAFRCALLLGGVDWMGWAGSTSAAHSDDDVVQTVAAFSSAIDRLREDGLVE